MINLIDSLNSKIECVPSQKDCIKLLHDYVTHDLFVNHYKEIESVLTGFSKTERTLSNVVDDLFIKRYVNEGFNGSPTNTSLSLDNILRENLTEHFQVMQYLSTLYKYSRTNKLNG